MEVPRRVRAGARPSGCGLVSRLLRPLLFSQRKIAGRDPSAPHRQERGLESRASHHQPADETPASNAPLESLAGGTLAARFHAWRGASGRRYICSVFQADFSQPDAGLPDFADAIAMAVARDGEGRRRRVALFLSEPTTAASARRAFIAEALAAGAMEWHIHLLAVDAGQRRATAKDIESCRFADPSAVR